MHCLLCLQYFHIFSPESATFNLVILSKGRLHPDDQVDLDVCSRMSRIEPSTFDRVVILQN